MSSSDINPANQPSSKSTNAKFVSRGGHKLRGALDAFGISVEGKRCLDVGSSTGGFTDCLLQAGASHVWCVDVGYGLLDYNLRKDPRVTVLERTNFRYFDPTALGDYRPELISVDLSFISLGKVLPKMGECLTPNGDIVAMVKPQFEGTPKEVPGGFVKDEPTRQLILERVKTFASAAGFHIRATADSLVQGRKGNQETFFHLTLGMIK